MSESIESLKKEIEDLKKERELLIKAIQDGAKLSADMVMKVKDNDKRCYYEL